MHRLQGWLRLCLDAGVGTRLLAKTQFDMDVPDFAYQLVSIDVY
jgi:hypothetical protein